jgi:hypothetical protein
VLVPVPVLVLVLVPVLVGDRCWVFGPRRRIVYSARSD